MSKLIYIFHVLVKDLYQRPVAWWGNQKKKKKKQQKKRKSPSPFTQKYNHSVILKRMTDVIRIIKLILVLKRISIRFFPYFNFFSKTRKTNKCHQDSKISILCHGVFVVAQFCLFILYDDNKVHTSQGQWGKGIVRTRAEQSGAHRGVILGNTTSFHVQNVFEPQLDILTCWEQPQKNWYKNCGKMKQRFCRRTENENRVIQSST